MRKYLLFLLIIFLIQYIVSKSIDTPPFNVSLLDNPAPGYLLMDPYQQGVINWIDNSGQPVYIKNLEQHNQIINLHLQPNGMLSFFSDSDKKFYVLDTNYAIVDSFECNDSYLTDFQEFVLLPNNNVLLVGQDKRIVDMSNIITDGKKDATVIGNIIQELDKEKNIVFEWDTFDHYKLTEIANDDDLKLQIIDFSHINNVFYDRDGNLIISASGLDEISKINRQTGEFIWRMGGTKCKNNQFTFLNDTIDGFLGFSHQHSVNRLSNGNILMFDNGNLKPKPFSRAVEFQIDESYKTIKKVWSYRTFPDTYSFSMGSVQRLFNGNTIIGWGDNDKLLTMTEVREDGSIAMEMNNFISDNVFRYVWKMAAMTLRYEQPGLYDFNDSSNNTGVSIAINTANDTGFISVERHYYSPDNISFGKNPKLNVYPNRWVVSNHGITEINAVLKFSMKDITVLDPIKVIIYARPNEGKGDFFPLDTTTFNPGSNTIETNINGFGEFILCTVPAVGVPLLNFPGNDSTNIEINVDFSWIPVINANSYHFQLSKDTDFVNIIVDSTGINVLNVICNNLDYDTKYFWRVKALRDTIASKWSDISCFTTMSRKELDAPSLLSPSYDSTDVPITGYLRWNPVNGAQSYNVELSLNYNFDSIILLRTNLKTPNFYYNNLDYNTMYYWHVLAINKITTGPWSDIWNFTTEKSTSVNSHKSENGVYVLTDFGGSVQFKLTIDKPGLLSLSIVDVTGRVLASVVNNNLNAGENIIILNSQTFTSGIYFYRLSYEGSIYHGKFMIE